jgi:hypothetical protein
VHERDHFRPHVPDRARHRVRRERRAPLGIDARDARAGAGGDVAHALAEHARDADHDGVAGLEQVDEARLHARRAGRGERQRERVLRAEQAAQALLHLVHQREELRVEVADERRRERLQHARMRVRGARA